MISRNQNLPGRRPGFAYQQTRRGLMRTKGPLVLQCEDIPLPKLAEKFGTPLYVYSTESISDRHLSFDRAFREIPHTICYSVKANSNLSILRLLARRGCGFDVVSAGELDRVLTAERRAAKRVVFS